MYFLRRFLVVVLLLWSGVILAASSLEKTLWRVEITPQGATIPDHVDRLRLQEGKFSSVIFDRKGFPATPYTYTENASGPVVWEAKQKSDTAGDLAWHAELNGDAMKGTLVWKQADGKTVSYSLLGSPVVEEASAEGAASGDVKAGRKSRWGCSLTQIR